MSSNEASSGANPALPVIEGWFTMDEADTHLIGSRCKRCGTYFFPGNVTFCRNPSCESDEFDVVPLSREGTIWSYTDAQYKPPEPYVAPDPFEPYAIAAVELEKERMIILGQLAKGVTVDDVTTGMHVELQLQTLFTKDGHDYLSWVWQPKR